MQRAVRDALDHHESRLPLRSEPDSLQRDGEGHESTDHESVIEERGRHSEQRKRGPELIAED